MVVSKKKQRVAGRVSDQPSLHSIKGWRDACMRERIEHLPRVARVGGATAHTSESSSAGHDRKANDASASRVNAVHMTHFMEVANAPEYRFVVTGGRLTT